ncbi:hypothetical protein JCM1840_001508 [Sporobolomyces johnsonii]
MHRKRQRTTSHTNGDAPPFSSSTSISKARLSTGDDAADLRTLLYKVSRCQAKWNGYPFFHPPALCDPSDRNYENVAYVVWKCKTPGCDYSAKTLVTAAPTAQLHSHGSRCAPGKKAQQKLTDMPAFGGLGKLESGEVLQLFALWCACGGRPFEIVEDSMLLPLLDEKARLHRPSANGISRAVEDLAELCGEKVLNLLERAFGAIYLAVDAWTSPSGVEVLGIVAFFKTTEGKGKPKDHVVPLTFVKGVVCDNTSNMRQMTEELSGYGLGTNQWIPCWADILNILATTLLAYFDNTGKFKSTDPKPPGDDDEPSMRDRHQALFTRTEAEEDEEDSDDVRRRQRRVGREARYYDMEDEAVDAVYAEARARTEKMPAAINQEEEDEKVDHFSPKLESVDDPYTRSSAKWSIRKAQRFAQKYRYDAATRNHLVDLSLSASPPPPGPHSVHPAVKTRWNSQARQIHQIINHRPQIEKIQNDPAFKVKEENKLTPADFGLFDDLLRVLQPFEEMMYEFSTKGGGDMEDLIPMVDRIWVHLQSFLYDEATVPVLHNAVVAVLDKLFFYYGKPRDCPYYAASILLHPALGIRYLRAQNWPQRWIDDAVKATQGLYNERHLDDARIARAKVQNNRPKSSTFVRSSLRPMDDDKIDLDKVVYNFSIARHARFDNEGNWIIALDYWKRRYVAGEMMEGLTLLALDVFGCPALSVDVERAESSGRFTSSDRYYSRSPVTLT